MNVIAGTAITQIGNVAVSQADFTGLGNALKALETRDEEISRLKQAIEDDSKEGKKEIGEKMQSWLKSLGGKLGDAGMKIGRRQRRWLYIW